MAKPDNLTGRAVDAAKWSYAGNIARAAVQFLIGIVLARILGPAAFGVVAIAWLMISVGKLVSDFGFGAALVQRDVLTPRDIHFALTIQFAIGAVLAVVGVAAAPFVANYFHHPEATQVIRAMALLFLLQAFSQTGTSLLVREMRFKSVQIANIATYLLGYLAVGVPAAWLGMGVWSLVAAQTVQAIGYTVWVVWLSGRRLGFATVPDAPGMLGFGGKVIGANLASWGIVNIDSLIVGRVFGVSDLGLYNRTMALVATPTATATISMQSVLFATCSRVQGNSARIKAVYLGATEVLALITMPVFVTIAAMPETVIHAVYGPAWIEGAAILAPLALAMPIHSMLAVAGPILMAVDKTALELRAQWLALLAIIPLLVIASTYSLSVLAWVVFASYLLRLALLVGTVQRLLGFTWREWLSTLQPAALCTLFVALPTCLVDFLLADHHPAGRLTIVVASAAILTAAAIRLLGPMVFRGPVGLAVGSTHHVPAALRRWARVA